MNGIWVDLFVRIQNFAIYFCQLMYRTKLYTGIVIYAYSFDEGYSVTYMFIHVRILRLNKGLSKNEEIDKVRELTAEYFFMFIWQST